MYSKLWSRAENNCKEAPKTSLNKLLAEYNKRLEDAARDNLINRRLQYQMRMWADTEFPMGEKQFQEKHEWLMKHGFNIALNHTNDQKFRHEPNKYFIFYTFVWLIEEILNKNLNLKRFIYGEGNEQFVFSELFLEIEADYHQHHGRQVARTERNENIQFDSYMTLVHNIVDYALNVGSEKQPLSDPPRM